MYHQWLPYRRRPAYSSGVFRPVDPGPEVDPDSWLGPAAIQAVDSLLASRPPRFADEIFQVMQEEQERNFCGPFLTRNDMDTIYGPGPWRPLERFIIEQADGKKRVIDNCRKTGHNAQTRLWRLFGLCPSTALHPSPVWWQSASPFLARRLRSSPGSI